MLLTNVLRGIWGCVRVFERLERLMMMGHVASCTFHLRLLPWIRGSGCGQVPGGVLTLLCGAPPRCLAPSQYLRLGLAISLQQSRPSLYSLPYGRGQAEGLSSVRELASPPRFQLCCTGMHYYACRATTAVKWPCPNSAEWYCSILVAPAHPLLASSLLDPSQANQPQASKHQHQPNPCTV